METTVAGSLRGWRCAAAATVRQVPPHRAIAIVAAAVILVAVVVCVPLPSAVELRDWATSIGPWFPLVFLATHIVVTTLPFPRTAFTLAAGLLFGPLLGITLAVVASTISALFALLLIRALGWQLNRLVRHPGIDSLDARLRHRGWPSIVSLRLIGAVPFAMLNYAAGASAVRVVPYLLATFVGLLPGTIAVVLLGDALTGHLDPLQLVISAATAAVGVVVLLLEVRAHRRDRRARARGQIAIAEPVPS